MIATAIHVVAAAGLGGVAGLLGGLFGVGGGFLVIPLLGFFFGMDQQTAQGTVLIMVVPNVVWAFSRYRRLFGIDLRMAAMSSVMRSISNAPPCPQTRHQDQAGIVTESNWPPEASISVTVLSAVMSFASASNSRSDFRSRSATATFAPRPVGAAGNEVVPASEYRALQSQVRELQRLLGKKTLGNEILREAWDLAQPKNAKTLPTLALMIALPVGVYSALRPYSLFDQIANMLASYPTFCSAHRNSGFGAMKSGSRR